MSYNYIMFAFVDLFLRSLCYFSPGPFIPKWPNFQKKVSFDFAIALCSINAPDIPENFAQRSEMENMVF